MLKIRFSRIGKKKKPIYRITVAEAAKDPYGRALEILGTYDPFSKELIIKKERIEHWISNGAQMSPSINNLLIEKKIIEGEKVTASKRGKKSEEEKTEAQETKKEETATEEKKDETAAEEKSE